MKLLKRIFHGLLTLFAILVIFLIGSVIVDGVLGGDRVMKLANTIVPGANGEPDVLAYVAKPHGNGPFPTVIMIHEFFGLNESIIGKAEGLADEGYYVVAPDTFRGSTTSWIPRAIYQVIKNIITPTVNADLDSVYAWLESQPEVRKNRIAIAGFCFGGRISLLYSLHNNKLAATVVFYGSPETDPEVLRALPGPVLGIFGGADYSIPVADVNSFEAGLQAAGLQHEITIYEGQPHAFMTDINAIRAGGVQGKAWAQMLAFLNDTLKRASSRENVQPIAYHTEFPWRYYTKLAYEHAFGSASHDP